MRGRPSRTVAQALKAGHLATRLADLMPLAEAPAAEEDAEGGGKAKDTAKAAGADGSDDDVVMVEAGPEPEERDKKAEGDKPQTEKGAAAKETQRMTQVRRGGGRC